MLNLSQKVFRQSILSVGYACFCNLVIAAFCINIFSSVDLFFSVYIIIQNVSHDRSKNDSFRFQILDSSMGVHLHHHSSVRYIPAVKFSLHNVYKSPDVHSCWRGAPIFHPFSYSFHTSLWFVLSLLHHGRDF